ncbi:MAG: putative DNA modification/repair radical SAM protein [Candidatus Auribacterota bacterium]|jgi:putative DNA modification/repair radical SAM protein|nr:putative DNA modification/repair radical SAM protein [Candidatus Auribacterota bacterium]
MLMLDKLHILADSAKYDASCASSGSSRNVRGKLGKASVGGVCHSWSSDGRCVSLLKILMTNACIYDCAYCLNRRSNDIPRAMLSPDEICELTVEFYRKNYIEGLFLSTGIVKNADYTMELLIQTARKLRKEHNFSGYLHIKLIPGASEELIDILGRYADRVSVNIELPSQQSLSILAPDKKLDAILTPMKQVKESIDTYKAEKKTLRRAPLFSPAGQSTQLIVGATPESDMQILVLSSWLYKKVAMKRVYYSAYIPVNNDKNLPALPTPPLLREHRLYQADWLLRFYDFEPDELLSPANPNLATEVDPKTAWALAHLDRFPVEVNVADYNTLLRVPGIGVQSARRIIRSRKVKRLRYEDLNKFRVVLKRARYFITVHGRYHGDMACDEQLLFKRLATGFGSNGNSSLIQLDLFDSLFSDRHSVITGEL